MKKKMFLILELVLVLHLQQKKNVFARLLTRPNYLIWKGERKIMSNTRLKLILKMKMIQMMISIFRENITFLSWYHMFAQKSTYCKCYVKSTLFSSGHMIKCHILSFKLDKQNFTTEISSEWIRMNHIQIVIRQRVRLLVAANRMWLKCRDAVQLILTLPECFGNHLVYLLQLNRNFFLPISNREGEQQLLQVKMSIDTLSILL